MNRNLFSTCTTITALALLAACGDSNTLAGPKGAPTVSGPRILAPAPTTTFLPRVGWRLPLFHEVPPSVTPW